MKIDAKEIIDALRLFFIQGDVFEIRVLDAVTRRGENGYITKSHVESGYFDYDHIDTIPQCLEHIISAKGVYFTPNPVDRTLLAKCANRIQQANTGDTTKDCNIVERRWLLIDCDVDHHGVTGVSSSDEEHNEALRVCESIKNAMYNVEWPIPMQIDTGNGANLMYPVRMGTSDAEQQIVSDILLALQEFDTENVKIDPAVKNLARLWRLPGTMNCKGDDIPERPHRMCRIWKRLPDDYDILGDAMLTISKYGAGKRTTANVAPVNQPSTLSDGVQSFNIDEWIRKYCPECGEPVVTNGTKKWFLSECPWGASHSSPQGAKDTYIAQMPSGAVCFKCSHAHCAGRDWHALRDLKEPDWRTKNLPAADPDVNLSGIVGGGMKPFEMLTPSAVAKADIEDIPIEELKETSDYTPFPEKLYDVHGLIKEVMDTTLKYAPSPNRPLALAGALSLMSFLCARKVKTESGLRPNIYILALAKSGSGKEKPRDINQRILEEIGLDNCLIETVASGEGLEDRLITHNALIWQCDEFYSIIKAMTNKQNDCKQAIMKNLLVLYTSSHKNLTTREKVGKPGVTIPKPHLTLFATTTPNGFFDSINDMFLNDGMFARLNIIIAEEPKRAKMMPEAQLSDSIIKSAKMWRDFIPPEGGNIDYQAMMVPFTESAREKADKLFEEQFDICEKFHKNDKDEWKAAAWNRFFELSMRYALIYSCSDAVSPEKAVITTEAIEWGSEFVRWEITNKINMTSARYSQNDFDNACESIIAFMKRWHENNGNEPMPAWKFNRLAKAFKDRKAMVENLKSQKRLFSDTTSTGGRPREVYWLAEFAPTKKEEEDGK